MNGHSNNIDTTQATEHLKNILNVGKLEMDSSQLKSVSNGSADISNDIDTAVSSSSFHRIELNTTKDSSHIAVNGTDVEVYSSPLESDATCSQIIVENVVDYGWEEKYYYGRLISVHLSGTFIAYVLRPPNNLSGFVRLIYRPTHKRHLIKDFSSEVKDIAFAHSESHIHLGSVDARGELLVHKIFFDGSAIQCSLLIHVCRSSDWVASDYNHIIWCLYIPEDSDNAEYDSSNDDVSTLLVVTHNERAEIWNIQTVWDNHGFGKLTVNEVKTGVQIITEHKQPISAATFSPDGTALAIGSIDGLVNFYQVQNFQNTTAQDIHTSPRCLHQWTPHPDKSLSSLYFLDNYKNHRPDVQLWKIAMTGADNNTELKIWSCETWGCLQTIRIYPNLEDTVQPCFKAEIDLSSKYLFLSDIKRKVLLIFLIMQESSGNAMICSLSEYRVPLPILSLAISSITQCKTSAPEECKLSDDEADCDLDAFLIKLYWIQSKTLQCCRIQYKSIMTSSLCSPDSIGSLSQDSFVFRDALSDTSLDRDVSSRTLKDLDISLTKILSLDDHSTIQSISSLPPITSHISPNYQKCSEVLLTPDDFTSPSRSHLSSHFEDIQPSTKLDSLPVEPCTLQRRKSSQHSAASSPSREVAEILAPMKVMMTLDDEIESKPSFPKNEALPNKLEPFSMDDSTVNQDYHLKEWPQAPDTSNNFLLSNRKESDHPNHRNDLFHPDTNETSTFPLDVNNKITKLNKNFENLVSKLDSMADMLHDQGCKIQSLQNNIKLVHQEQNFTQPSSQDAFFAKFEHAITQSLIPHYSQIEGLMSMKADELKKYVNRDFTVLSNNYSTTLSNCLDAALKHELLNNIVPQVNKVLDTIAHKMQTDFNQTLSATDVNLRDNFNKHLKSKVFTDNIAQAISIPLQNILQSSCKDIFQSCVIPSFEKACHQLFLQMNELFHKGTSEYLQFFEKQSQKYCIALETSTKCIKDEINNLSHIKQETTKNQTRKVESQHLDSFKQEIMTEIRQAIVEEVRRGFREQQVSRAATPISVTDPQIQIHHLKQLIQQGKLSDAFQQALSAVDLQLVLYVCESVSVDEVFGSATCPLQQHVLLSLVNQLSSDLSMKTDIKVKYIEDVISSLDTNNPIIRDHVHGVLESLQQRVSTFLVKYPSHRLARNFRRISLALSSLLKC